jgi:homoaconitate hydratase
MPLVGSKSSSLPHDLLRKAVATDFDGKIPQRYAVGLPLKMRVRSGDYISLAPELCMSHDNSWLIVLKLMSIGATRIRNPQQIVMTVDRDLQNSSNQTLKVPADRRLR